MTTIVSTGPASPSMRPFLVIWIGQAGSLLGSQLVQFALVWWLTKATGSATVLALASLAALLPKRSLNKPPQNSLAVGLAFCYTISAFYSDRIDGRQQGCFYIQNARSREFSDRSNDSESWPGRNVQKPGEVSRERESLDTVVG